MTSSDSFESIPKAVKMLGSKWELTWEYSKNVGIAQDYPSAEPRGLRLQQVGRE